MRPIACVLLSGLLTGFVWADIESPTLSVRGEAQIQVAPDQVSITIGVFSEADVAKDALANNNQAMAKVVAAIEALGLGKDDYKTQQFSISPIWSSRPKIANSSWQAKTTGYRVNNSVVATTQRLDLIGNIINKATAAGANSVQSIVFGLSNPRRYRQQAIEMAVKNAQVDAKTLAQASGNHIVGTHSIHLDNAVASQKRVNTEFMARAASLSDSVAPPINAGDITVNASVSIVYKLDD